ncbi:cystathionine gamma-lyase-like [Watersipora subatra]|uniref:cystathionine gamma-lyase-like n=1 Tax=Watersipora subatra TaxID=2589382 RepID=UPI00355AE105
MDIGFHCFHSLLKRSSAAVLTGFVFHSCGNFVSMADKSTFPGFATDALHVGQEPEQWSSRAVIPPISLSTTFKQYEPGVPYSGYEYSRSGNPTRSCLEKCLASLEGAKHGLVFSSGLGATTTMIHTLKAGDHIVSIDDVYGGTNRYFSTVASKFGVEVTFCDMTNSENLRAAMKPSTKIVWIESPTNPLLKLADISALADIAHQQEGVTVVVDNTFTSPYFQRPLDLGADLTFHSISKYINGHTDVIMGCFMTNSDDLEKQLRFLQNAIGTVPAPFDCYMVNRGVKTLHLRMREHMRNGLMVARALETNPRVTKVIHPGLESHPQHELALKQMKGFSGMVSFYIKGGLKEATLFMQSVKVFCLAESLGGYESLCELPSVMTHASVPPETREKLGISDSLIRLSVGIEDGDRLVEDLQTALQIAVPM